MCAHGACARTIHKVGATAGRSLKGDDMSQRTAALEALRDDLIARIERYQASKQRSEGALDKDLEDQSIELENSEVIDSLENEAEAELRQVMHALERIEAGEGERCERCGTTIDDKRLTALPYTTRCINCAEQLSGF